MYYDELYHHGIKGQKWGVRRFQNLDGTLIKLGKKVGQEIRDRRQFNQLKKNFFKLHVNLQTIIDGIIIDIRQIRKCINQVQIL